jgi:hypothetical protein
LHVISTGEQLRLGYNNTLYSIFQTDSAGRLHVYPGSADTMILFGQPNTDPVKVAFTRYDGASWHESYIGYLDTSNQLQMDSNGGQVQIPNDGLYVYGNVGIGTNNPQAKLHVIGDIKAQGKIHPKGEGTGEYIINGQDAGLGDWGLGFYTAYQNRMYIRNDGKVGIGTTNPGGKLAVYDTSSGVVAQFVRELSSLIDLGTQGTGSDAGFRIFSGSLLPMRQCGLDGANNIFLIGRGPDFPSHGSRDIQIDNSGRVHIWGGIAEPPQTPYTPIARFHVTPLPVDNYVVFIASQNNSENTPHMAILASGRIGIQTNNPQYTLHVNGSFAASTKNFEIDHPTKPGMKLVHACIEGPEVAVFYRGEGKLINGEAVVELPDYFEALTRREGRTVQLTPKGAEPYLLSATDVVDGKFKVYGSKPDGSFYWEVKAVRADVEPLKVEVERK